MVNHFFLANSKKLIYNAGVDYLEDPPDPSAPGMKIYAAGIALHLKFIVPWLSVLLLSGCFPRLVWLPDSSGVAYTAGPRGNLLVVHDLARGKPLVKELPGRVNVPAVSPDGRLLAVALLTGQSTDNRLRILVLDRDGREIHRSDEFPWRQELGKSYTQGPLGAEVYWAPSGSRLVVAGASRVGFYDLKTRQLDVQPGMAGAGPLVFGGKCLAPQNRGFLIRRENCFELVDWSGRAQPLRDGLADANLQQDQLADMMTSWPFLFSSGWEEDAAVVSWGKHRFRFDTAKMTAHLAVIRPEWTDDGKLVQQQFSFGRGKATVRVVELAARNPGVGGDGQQGTFGTFRLDLSRPGEAKFQVLLPRISGFVQMVPAPNRQLLAIDCLVDRADQQPHERFIVILDAGGRLLSQISTVFPRLGKAE